MDLNRVTVMGNVGADPEFFNMQSGGELCKFSIATTRKWKDKDSGERKEDTQWHNVVVFNKYILKVVKQFVQKGTRVYIEGESKTRSYEQDGQRKFINEIVIPAVKGELIVIARGKGWDSDSPRSSADRGQSNKEWIDEYDNGPASPPPDYDDDIPF